MVKERLQKNFSLLLTLILLVLTIVLAFAVMEKSTILEGRNSSSGNVTGQDFPPPGVQSYTFYHINATDYPATNKTPGDPYPLIFNQTPPGGLAYSEFIIAYFREMPESADEFAAAYGIKPVFVKDEIKMAAFEVENHLVLGVSDGKTGEAIEKLSNDSRVEMVKKDTYMFTGGETEIKTTPTVKYPEDYKDGYVPNQVMVGFWRLPQSLEEFGAKYGGKPVNISESDLNIQMVMYETQDMRGFIDRASKDRYVRYIELNGYFRAFDGPVLIYDPYFHKEYRPEDLSQKPDVSKDDAMEIASREFPGTNVESYYPSLYLWWIEDEQRLVWTVNVPGGTVIIDATTGSIIKVNRVV